MARVLELWAWAMLWWEGLRPWASMSTFATERVAMGDRLPVPDSMWLRATLTPAKAKRPHMEPDHGDACKCVHVGQ